MYCGVGIDVGNYKLCPPAKPPSSSNTNGVGHVLGGAVLVSAGDIVELEVEVRSLLPEPISLSNAVLVLVPYCNPENPQDSGKIWLSAYISGRLESVSIAALILLYFEGGKM